MFKDRLKYERKALGWTQQKLADKVNTSRSNVANWELGNNEASPELLGKLADLFQCSTDYLLGRTDKRTIYDEWDEKYSIDKTELNNLESITKSLSNKQKSELGINTLISDKDGDTLVSSMLLMEKLIEEGIIEKNKPITDKQINVITEFLKNNQYMIKKIMEEDD